MRGILGSSELFPHMGIKVPLNYLLPQWRGACDWETVLRSRQLWERAHVRGFNFHIRTEIGQVRQGKSWRAGRWQWYRTASTQRETLVRDWQR